MPKMVEKIIKTIQCWSWPKLLSLAQKTRKIAPNWLWNSNKNYPKKHRHGLKHSKLSNKWKQGPKLSKWPWFQIQADFKIQKMARKRKQKPHKFQKLFKKTPKAKKPRKIALKIVKMASQKVKLFLILRTGFKKSIFLLCYCVYLFG